MPSISEKVINFREKVGRIGGFAMLDVSLTVASAALISQYADEPFYRILLILWVIGEGFHLASDVDTPVTEFIKNNVYRTPKQKIN